MKTLREIMNQEDDFIENTLIRITSKETFEKLVRKIIEIEPKMSVKLGLQWQRFSDKGSYTVMRLYDKTCWVKGSPSDYENFSSRVINDYEFLESDEAEY